MQEKIKIEGEKMKDDMLDEGKGSDDEVFFCYLRPLVDDADYGVLLDGTVRTWQGITRGGAYAYTWDDFRRLLSEYEIIALRVGKKLTLELVRHDGVHRFEVRRVTKKGKQWMDNHPYMGNEEYAEKLASVRCYTRNAY